MYTIINESPKAIYSVIFSILFLAFFKFIIRIPKEHRFELNQAMKTGSHEKIINA